MIVSESSEQERSTSVDCFTGNKVIGKASTRKIRRVDLDNLERKLQENQADLEKALSSIKKAKRVDRRTMSLHIRF